MDDLTAGARLGPYRLGERLGSGTNGTVYLAEVAEDRPFATVGERLAIKVLRDAGSTSRVHVHDESRHPRVVTTHAVESAPVDGRRVDFVVMELAEGLSLRARLERDDRLPEPEVQTIATQLAHALAAIHACRLLHRDVKPENVQLTPSQGARLLDLGLATSVGRFGMTLHGEFQGTPAQAAPEQARGVTGPAADLYALGVTLFEAATGTNPFAAESVEETLRRHASLPPPKAREHAPEVSPFLSAVLCCLLAKSPRDRFASADLLASTLEAGESSPWWRRLAERSGPAAALFESPSTALVGRRSHVSALRDAIARVRQGVGGSVLVSGEAGVGKTRLMQHVVHELDRLGPGHVLLAGAHRPGTWTPLGAVSGSLVGHFGDRMEEEFVRLLPDYEERATDLARFLRDAVDAPALGQTSLTTLLVSVVQGLAAESPIVWILEDIHWATDESKSMLDVLVDLAGDAPLLVIATARPGDSGPVLAPERESHQVLELERLDEEDTRALLTSHGSLDMEHVERVSHRSGGNALFAMELARQLGSGSGALDGSLPTTLAQLCDRRLEQAEKGQRRILELAACHGTDVEHELLARASGSSRADTDEAIRALDEKGLIRGGGGIVRFDHPLLPERLYECLSESARRRCHRRLASAFHERLSTGRSSSVQLDKVALVRHALVGRDIAIAKDHVVEALEELVRRRQLDAATELCELALEQGDDAEPSHATLAFIDLDVHCRRYRFQEAISAGNVALKLARATTDVTLQAKVLHRLADAHTMVGDPTSALRHLDLVDEQALAEHDEVRLKMDLDRAEANVLLSRFDEALELANRVLAEARRVGARSKAAEALDSLGAIHAEQGRYQEAASAFRSALVESSDPMHVLITQTRLGLVELQLGEYQAARQTLSEQLRLSRQGRRNVLVAVGVGNLGKLHFCLGELEHARERYHEAREALQSIGDRRGRAMASLHLAQVALEEGDLPEAEGLLRAASDLAEDLEDKGAVAHVSLYHGYLARVRGDHAAAVKAARESLDVFVEREDHAGAADSLLLLGRLALDAGDVDAAEARLMEAAERTAESSLLDPGALPLAYLHAIGRPPPDSAVDVDPRSPVHVQAEAHVVLAGMPDARHHLSLARVLLGRLSAHLQEPAARERSWAQSATARAYLRAGGERF